VKDQFARVIVNRRGIDANGLLVVLELRPYRAGAPREDARGTPSAEQRR